MWKLIYSDYEQDRIKNKVTKVHGEILTGIHNVLDNYSIIDKTRFTVVGLYADNKKYTVVCKTNNQLYNYVFAIKPYSTHKDNQKYWLNIVDLSNNQITEFVANSTNLLSDIEKFVEFVDNIKTENAYPIGNLKQFFEFDSVNDKFNNGQLYTASISEIDRVWVEQMRGENFLK